MKKMLLMLCAISCIVSTQGVTKNVTKEKSFIQQLIKDRQGEGGISVRTGEESNLLDSIKTYYGEDKTLVAKAAITYDENNRISQEKGLKDINGDGLLDESEAYKIDYTYTSKDGSLEVEVVTSFLVDEEWVSADKEVSLYHEADLNVPLEYYVYYFNEDEWVLDWKTVVTEYDDEERPIVFMDSTFNETMSDTSVVRIEAAYNEKGLYDLFTFYTPAVVPLETSETEEEWIPNEKMEVTYDDEDKHVKDSYYDYDSETEDWTYSYMTEYTYDEKGNLTSEIETGKDGEVGDAIYYENVYSSGSSNDVILVESGVYPNPASDVLYVKIEGADNAVLTLVNAQGSMLMQQKTDSQLISIPVSNYDKGYYFLIIRTNKGTKTHKVIIR